MSAPQSHSKDDRVYNESFKFQEAALKTAKEITVKFIECGKVTPSSFNRVFPEVYKTVIETVRGE